MNLEELKTHIINAGIVGAGGAGFPTHIKLNSEADTVILNGAECEPLLKVDKHLFSLYADNILETLNTISDSLKAKAIVALKKSNKSAIEAVQKVIKRYNNIELKLLLDVYPAGDEAILVYETTGRIVPEGAIPISVGAVVLNTETVFNIYKAINFNEAVTEKYVTITGAVKNPMTVKVPIGIEISELISLVGGAAITDYKILCGGPMTGSIVDEGDCVTKTTKAIIILPSNHPVINKKIGNTSIMLKRAMSVCSQCQMCTNLCPRNLLGHNIQPHKIMRGLSGGLSINIEDYTGVMLCSECGLCEMYACHQSLSPRVIIKEIKNKLKKYGIKNPHNNSSMTVNVMREHRMVPMKRLIERLGLSRYEDEASIKEVTLDINSVEISLSQHIGVKAVPVVEKGKLVAKGDVIAKVPQGQLGAVIHASINGSVKAVYENSIIISKVSVK